MLNCVYEKTVCLLVKYNLGVNLTFLQLWRVWLLQNRASSWRTTFIPSIVQFQWDHSMIFTTMSRNFYFFQFQTISQGSYDFVFSGNKNHTKLWEFHLTEIKIMFLFPKILLIIIRPFFRKSEWFFLFSLVFNQEIQIIFWFR